MAIIAMRFCDVGAISEIRSTPYFLHIRLKFVLFLKRNIRQNQAVYADLLACGYKAFGAIGEHDVGVSHKDHGHAYVAAKLAHKVEYFIGGNAAAERA